MRLALRVSEEGEVTDLDLDAPEGALNVLQTAVDGNIEPVMLTDDLEFYVDEEGLYNKTAHNGVAEMLYRVTYNDVIPLMGPAVFTGGIDEEGETRGLSDETARRVRGAARTVCLLGNGIVWELLQP